MSVRESTQASRQMHPSRKGPFLFLCSFFFFFLFLFILKILHLVLSFAKHISNFSPVSTARHCGQANDYHCTPGEETEAAGAAETESRSVNHQPAVPLVLVPGQALKSGLESG